MFLTFHFRSDSLGMETSANVILPDTARRGTSCRTVYLLHGLKGDHNSWVRQTSIERYASALGIAVVMPDGARSWYTDTADCASYLTYITEELPQVCRGVFSGITGERADTFIAGLSMGGYGAVKAALTHPENFAGCASLSGSMDIASTARRFVLDEWRGVFGFDFTGAADLAGTKHDIFTLARELHAAGKPLPRIYQWCGTEDSLLDANRRFAALLDEIGAEHAYAESEGDHSWRWWDAHITEALTWLLEK